MTRRAGSGVIGAVLLFTGVAAAQPPAQPPSPTQPQPQVPTRPQPQPPAGPQPSVTTTPRPLSDSTRQDSTLKPLVEWPAEDSVALSLRARKDMTMARFLGDTIAMTSSDSGAFMGRVTGKPAAVEQGTTVIRGSMIAYDGTTELVGAQGDTVIIRDPSRNAADLVITPMAAVVYDRRGGSANVNNVKAIFPEGNQLWTVFARSAAFRTDTTTDQHIFYGHLGDITSCTDSIPHYHFSAKDVKFISGRLMIARSATLYLADIPVMWLPFLVQDLRSGQRSGLLTPRFGASEIIRSNPGYRRNVENLGYYAALNDYMDALGWIDWRSGAKETTGDPGFVRYNLEWNYKVLSRFLSGRLSASRLRQQDGLSNTSISFSHQQSFSQTRSLQANINYMTSTTVGRRNEFITARATATVDSRLNYQQTLGPFAMSLGGSRRQYPGLSQVDQTFPTLSLTTKPLEAGPLVWSPSLQMSNSQRFHVPPVGPLGYRYVPNALGGIDSVGINRTERSTTASFDTPIKLFGFVFRNSFSLNDIEHNYPETFIVRDVRDSSVRATKTFLRTFRTDLDWNTGITLPPLSQQWNLLPSFAIVNVDPSPFWVRNELTGGKFIHQSKRMQYSIGIAPSIYGFFGGFGPFSRLRHTISPGISYSYAPRGHVSDEYLAALGRTRQGYLGALPQSQISLTLRQTIEAKYKTAGDTGQADARKVRLLSMDFEPISWDFERAKATGHTGLSSDHFGFTARSDLLPTFDLGVGYSLFQGSLVSDTARFKPFRESLRTSFTLDAAHNPFGWLVRAFGGAAPSALPSGGSEAAIAQRDSLTAAANDALHQAAGSAARNPQVLAPTTSAWYWRLNYTSSRQRPPSGSNIVDVDDRAICAKLSADPVVQDRCYIERQAAQIGNPNTDQTALGGLFRRIPPSASISSQLSTPLTQFWFADWSTSYDVTLHRFASQAVTLRRQLHDWDAVFTVNKVPNGNFSFAFFVALRAAPDLKFDYNQQSYPRTTQQ